MLYNILMKILLVNPPIYDFTAYDFWLKPLGMLTVAGFLRNGADFHLFDYLDRTHPFYDDNDQLKSDQYGRGRFHEQIIDSPEVLTKIPRHFRRYGLPQKFFKDFLIQNAPFDFAFIQTTMTYWYLGLKEVIDDIRNLCPNTKIILGGNYATLCPDHAKNLGPELIVKTDRFDPLWKMLNTQPDFSQPALWESYTKQEVFPKSALKTKMRTFGDWQGGRSRHSQHYSDGDRRRPDDKRAICRPNEVLGWLLTTAAVKLTDGCPFKCTYCFVPKVYKNFKPRPLDRCLKELHLLHKLGAKNIAFYDDALLYKPEEILIGFLNEAIKKDYNFNFHSPNALNARFITRPLAELMVQAGFKTFYLGFESSSEQFQKRTGSKVFSNELARAVKLLIDAGADPKNITAYQILGHPLGDLQQLERSMHFAHDLGIKNMLADFSPIPGTPDGNYCHRFTDMTEPLNHNKTAFPVVLLGFDETNRLKNLCQTLNRSL